MEIRIEKDGNYIVAKTPNGAIKYEVPSKDTRCKVAGTNIHLIDNVGLENSGNGVKLTEAIENFKDDVGDPLSPDVITWLRANTGFNPATGGSVAAWVLDILARGGIVEDSTYQNEQVELYPSASLVYVPGSYENGVAYVQKPLPQDIGLPNFFSANGWTVDLGLGTFVGVNATQNFAVWSDYIFPFNTFYVTYTVSNYTSGTFQFKVGDTAGADGYYSPIVSANGDYTFAVSGIDFTNTTLYMTGVAFFGTVSNIVWSETADFTVARDSEVQTIGTDGALRTLTSNCPAITHKKGYPSLLVQPSATNLYLNSDVMVTQDVTTVADEYNVSFFGTGTITFTGTYTGSLVGTGVNDRVDLTFTATAGTLTSTVSGSCTNANCVEYPAVTSPIESDGSEGIRLTDLIGRGGNIGCINSPEGVFVLKLSAFADNEMNRIISISDGTLTNQINFRVRQGSSNRIYCEMSSSDGLSTNFNTTSFDITQDMEIALQWTAGKQVLYINGTAEVTRTDANSFSADTLDRINTSRADENNTWQGDLDLLLIYPSVAAAEADIDYITA